MKAILQKTFGGLPFSYYIRQFLFGLIFYIFLIYQAIHLSYQISSIIMFTVCQFLYPYSRFVYESIVSYILGNNSFLVNASFMLIVKVMTMALCWIFAPFIAPIGLAYLYYYHSKQEKNFNSQ